MTRAALALLLMPWSATVEILNAYDIIKIAFGD
jgi:hypothetical protein